MFFYLAERLSAIPGIAPLKRDARVTRHAYHIFIFLVPTNVWVYVGLWMFSAVWTIMIHDRVRWSPDFLGPIVNHTGCHTAHHWHCRYNYGNYFTFWDKLCGTYFDPEHLPEQFFAVKSSRKSSLQSSPVIKPPIAVPSAPAPVIAD